MIFRPWNPSELNLLTCNTHLSPVVCFRHHVWNCFFFKFGSCIRLYLLSPPRTKLLCWPKNGAGMQYRIHIFIVKCNKTSNGHMTSESIRALWSTLYLHSSVCCGQGYRRPPFFCTFLTGLQNFAGTDTIRIQRSGMAWQIYGRSFCQILDKQLRTTLKLSWQSYWKKWAASFGGIEKLLVTDSQIWYKADLGRMLRVDLRHSGRWRSEHWMMSR